MSLVNVKRAQQSACSCAQDKSRLLITLNTPILLSRLFEPVLSDLLIHRVYRDINMFSHQRLNCREKVNAAQLQLLFLGSYGVMKIYASCSVTPLCIRVLTLEALWCCNVQDFRNGNCLAKTNSFGVCSSTVCVVGRQVIRSNHREDNSRAFSRSDTRQSVPSMQTHKHYRTGAGHRSTNAPFSQVQFPYNYIVRTHYTNAYNVKSVTVSLTQPGSHSFPISR